MLSRLRDIVGLRKKSPIAETQAAPDSAGHSAFEGDAPPTPLNIIDPDKYIVGKNFVIANPDYAAPAPAPAKEYKVVRRDYIEKSVAAPIGPFEDVFPEMEYYLDLNPHVGHVLVHVTEIRRFDNGEIHVVYTNQDPVYCGKLPITEFKARAKRIVTRQIPYDLLESA